MEKTLLFLGGARQQIPVIEKAKERGIHVITCDYLPENPGHRLADEYYNVSTTNRGEVLELAKHCRVDGIVCYASDPAAPVAAYVAKQLHIPGNCYQGVEILSDKGKFREFLAQNGFAVPKSRVYERYEQFCKEANLFEMPYMIKPVDSSGSKGVSCITQQEEIEAAFACALSYSRQKRVIVEEYVEANGYQVAGDGFSINGRLVFWCFGNDHFDVDNTVNPFVPVSASFPFQRSRQMEEKIVAEIQRAFDLLSMGTGAYNFDIRVGMDGRVYLMEIGPRNGGNYIPQVIWHATGIDMVDYTIRAALGEDCSSIRTKRQANGFWSYYALHSKKQGRIQKITVAKNMQKCIVEAYMNYKIGDFVESYTGSNGTIGIYIMHFDSSKEMLWAMDHGAQWLQLEVCE